MTFRRLFRRLVLAATPLALGYHCGNAQVSCGDGVRSFEFMGTAVPDGGLADFSSDHLDAGTVSDLGSDMGDGGDAPDLGAAAGDDCLALCQRAAAAYIYTIDTSDIDYCEIDANGQGRCTVSFPVGLCEPSSGCSSSPGCGGRTLYGRPLAGLRPPVLPADGDPIGTYLANAAYLEAASIESFRILAAELLAHDAPPALIAAAHQAAQDEEIHAQLMGMLAARHGVTAPMPPPSPARALRELPAIAIENAVEGCIHETWSALLVTWQAAHIPEPAMREVFRQLASDETNHASLAWQVAAWIEQRLDEITRRSVRKAAMEARTMLRSAPHHAMSEAANHDLGLPSGAVHQALVDGLIMAIWKDLRHA